MKKKFMTMHIHSSNSSWSSNDEHLYREIYTSPKGYVEETYGDNLIEVFTYEDKTYYDMRPIFDSATKDQMKKLVSKYVGEGWSTRRPKEIDEYFERVKAADIESRRQRGCVVVDDYDYDYDNYNRDDYKGSLSDALWAVPHCVSYTSTPCFGYYGHSGRTHDIDKFIEAEFKSHGASLEEIDMWMSSSYARHAMDYHEGASFDINKVYISKNIDAWIDEARDMMRNNV